MTTAKTPDNRRWVPDVPAPEQYRVVEIVAAAVDVDPATVFQWGADGLIGSKLNRTTGRLVYSLKDARNRAKRMRQDVGPQRLDVPID